jgi:hypothetical protein
VSDQSRRCGACFAPIPADTGANCPYCAAPLASSAPPARDPVDDARSGGPGQQPDQQAEQVPDSVGSSQPQYNPDDDGSPPASSGATTRKIVFVLVLILLFGVVVAFSCRGCFFGGGGYGSRGYRSTGGRYGGGGGGYGYGK